MFPVRKKTQMKAVSDTMTTPTTVSAQGSSASNSATVSARMSASSSPEKTAIAKALSESSRRAARGGCARPTRSSINPSVRHAAATIGQAMVIQFMACYRPLWPRSEATLVPSDAQITTHIGGKWERGNQPYHAAPSPATRPRQDSTWMDLTASAYEDRRRGNGAGAFTAVSKVRPGPGGSLRAHRSRSPSCGNSRHNRPHRPARGLEDRHER